MMAEVAEAVHHAHQAGVIHRDLKPANILVELQGHPWVLDFGLADFRGEPIGPPASSGSDGEADPGNPTVGVGTLPYMAPEQLPDRLALADVGRPTNQDARTDVWGLGATLYELITLHRPFEAATEAEVARKILAERPTLPKQHQPAIPLELEAVCLKALEKDPGDRYPTAAAFAADLRRWLDGVPTEAVRRTSCGGRECGPSGVPLMRDWSRRDWSSCCCSLVRLSMRPGLVLRPCNVISICSPSNGYEPQFDAWIGSRTSGSTSASFAPGVHHAILCFRARPQQRSKASTSRT